MSELTKDEIDFILKALHSISFQGNVAQLKTAIEKVAAIENKLLDMKEKTHE